MKSNLVNVLSILGVAGIASCAIGGIAETDWNSGTLEGWTFTASAGGDWVNPNAGGNGGGYVQYNDGVDGSLPTPQLFAPGQYLGDYTSYVSGGYFEYDIILSGTPGPGEPTNYPRIRLVGADGSEARVIQDYLVDANWQTIQVNIAEAEWEMVSGTWAGLIADVDSLYFGGDLLVGSGPEGGVDNFRLVPSAPTASILMISLAGMARRRR